MKYTVAFNRKNEIEKMLNKLQKKANKYGTGRIEYSFGDKYMEEIPVYAVDHVNHCQRKVRTMHVEAVDVEIEAEEIKYGDHKVIAMIEHLSEGANIVTPFGVENKHKWMICHPLCEHCKSNRVRKFTFIVEDNKTGEQKQIGKNCLKDYSGIDPEYAVMIRQLEQAITEEDFSREDYEYHGNVEHFVEVEEALAYAIDVYRKNGYVRTSEPRNNRDIIDHLIRTKESDPSTESVKLSKEIISTISSFDSVTAYKNGFDNVWSIIQNTYIKLEKIGYIAYVPVSYEKYINRKKAYEEKIAVDATSEWVGTVGKRQSFNIKKTKLITSWRNDFGIVGLFKMTDNNGNVIILKSSSYPFVEEDGKTKLFNSGIIKATVKEHEERNGIKQTVVQRLKIESVTSTSNW